MPWGEDGYTAPPSGSDLKLRREEVGVSQALIAWAARVSRNTVGNLERGQGEPEERVLKNVCAALGVKSKWKMGFDAPEDESHILFSADAVKRLFAIIVDDIQPKSSKRAREAIDAFRRLTETEDHGLFERSELRAQTTMLADYLAPYLQSEDQAVIEAFLERGWSPEDSQNITASDLQEEMQANLRRRPPPFEQDSQVDASALQREVRTIQRKIAEMARVSMPSAPPGSTFEYSPEFRTVIGMAETFQRLPVRVQEALLSGQVLDSEITVPPNTNGFSMVNLVVRHDNPSNKATSTEDRKALINALHVWHLALVIAGDGFKVMQDHKWMAPQDVEKRIRAALSVIAESEEEGLSKPAPHDGLEEE